jgi:hypothetical protein
VIDMKAKTSKIETKCQLFNPYKQSMEVMNDFMKDKNISGIEILPIPVHKNVENFAVAIYWFE